MAERDPERPLFRLSTPAEVLVTSVEALGEYIDRRVGEVVAGLIDSGDVKGLLLLSNASLTAARALYEQQDRRDG